MIPMAARHKCIEALDAVSESHLDQKVERAINRWGLGGAIIAQPLKHIIRLDRSIRFKEEGEYLPAQWRQGATSPAAKVLGFAQCSCELAGATGKMKVRLIRNASHRCLRAGARRSRLVALRVQNGEWSLPVLVNCTSDDTELHANTRGALWPKHGLKACRLPGA